jgi:type IV pilus assembly protein PilO
MSFADDLKRLDVNNIGNWPVAFKAIAVGLICAAVLGAGVYFDTMGQLATLRAAEGKEASLKKTFEEKQSKAVSLNAYKKQMEEMQKVFGEMLRQLPSKTEVAALLVDISQVGVAAGLDFELFKPEPEIPVEFYAELPIKIRVNGNYHQFGTFVSGVAALPRIVTLHDFVISQVKDAKAKDSKRKGPLIMEATAKTYRYLDEDEIAKEAAKRKELEKDAKKKKKK